MTDFSRYSDNSRQKQEIFLFSSVQAKCGAHPASYPVGTGGSFLKDKAIEAWSWPLTSIWCRGKKMVELYPHSPISLHGVVLN
jgi:hypothetical protein